MTHSAPSPRKPRFRRSQRFLSRLCSQLVPRLVLGSVLLLAAGLVAPGSFDAQDAGRHGIFIDSIDVNLVNIEVMVYDKDGNPVRGLTEEDFQVLVDKDAVEITNFFAVEGGDRVIQGEEIESLPVEASGAAPPPEEQRYLVLYVDNGNIAANHRKRVFDDLRENLDDLMQPADRVAVIGQDGAVTIEQPFTSDRELVEAAIDRMAKVTGRGAMRSLEPRLIQRDIEAGEAPPGADTLASGTTPGSGGPFQRPTFDVDARRTFSQVTNYAQQAQNQGQLTLANLSRFINSLAGLPGRKAVVYISDGLELAPGDYLFRIWDYKYATIASEEVGISNIDAEIDRYRLRDQFQELISEANANRVAFYTIEGGSQRGAGDISAETSVAIVDPLARTADGEREESLRALAYETGGVPLLNSGAVTHVLTQLRTDFSNYYSLGYPSPHTGDGKFHRVQVRVKDHPEYKLRYLEGYKDKDSDERMTDQTLATLLHDVGENPLDVQVEIGNQSPVKGKGKGYIVPVLVKIPMSKLVLIPQDEAHLGRLSIYIAVRDEVGRLSDPQKIDVPVRIPNEQLLSAMGQTAGYAAEIQMRPGEQKLAIGVRDELAAVASTLNLNLQVGGG